MREIPQINSGSIYRRATIWSRKKIVSHKNLVGDIPSRPYAICNNFTEPFQNAPQCGATLSKVKGDNPTIGIILCSKRNWKRTSLPHRTGGANGIEVQRTNYSSWAGFWRFPIYCRSRQIATRFHESSVTSDQINGYLAHLHLGEKSPASIATALTAIKFIAMSGKPISAALWRR